VRYDESLATIILFTPSDPITEIKILHSRGEDASPDQFDFYHKSGRLQQLALHSTPMALSNSESEDIIRFSLDTDAGESITGFYCIYKSVHDADPCVEAGVFGRSHGLAAELEFMDIRIETNLGRFSPWVCEGRDRGQYYKFALRVLLSDDSVLTGLYTDGSGSHSKIGLLTRKSSQGFRPLKSLGLGSTN
jgi:hypothetical protein